MNFSENRKLRRFLSLILSLVMITTLFAGCKKDEEPQDTTEAGLNLNLSETETPTETQTEPTETTAPEINENTATATAKINVRSWPTTAELGDNIFVGTLEVGDRVEISRVEHASGADWAYIISPMDGWVMMEYLVMDIPSDNIYANSNSTPAGNNPTEETQPTASNATQNIKGVINANGLNIRSEASTDGKVQGTYNKGDVVTILEVKNGWGRTNKGWVKMDYVTTTGTNNTTNNSDSNNTTGNNTTGNNTNQNTATNITGNGSTTVVLKGVVRVAELNIRASASTDSDRLGSYTYGDRVEVLEKSGSWGRTKKGWIHLDYVYQDGTTGTKTGNGTITGNGLNIRSGPGTGYGAVGSYNSGDRVTILEQFTYGNTTWGCTNKGWISMQYVDMDGTVSNNTTTSTKLATVIGDKLNIRSGPGTTYGSVGYLTAGETVTILKTTVVDGVTWGNIAQGWISMQYVEVDQNT